MADDKYYMDMDKIIFGCGNILFGDDAFGPMVIDYFNEHYELPRDTLAINVQTSIRGLLFNLLLKEDKPSLILIIDAVDKGFPPGKIFEIELDGIPETKVDDLSMHQMPSSNLLKELKDESEVQIQILVAQVKNIPEEISPGLSDELKDSIQPMCNEIIKILEKYGVEVKQK